MQMTHKTVERKLNEIPELRSCWLECNDSAKKGWKTKIL